PSLDSDFTYPASLKTELLAALPGYVIEPARIPDRRARAAEFRRSIDAHEKAVGFLMSRGEWDFLMVVFSVLDRAQHDYWADMDPSHPRHDPKTPREFREFVHETYQRLDATVARLIEHLPADSRVFVVSDHGFCSELFEVRVNEVLAEAGLLAFKVGRQTRSRVRSLGEKISRRLIPPRSNGNVLQKKVEYGRAFLDEIDWSRTRAFFAQDKGIWANLAGRESEGIVRESDFDEVIEEARAVLLSLVSPEDGEPVFEKVMRRDEAFNGLYSQRLPDLVMIPRRDEFVYNERPGYGARIVPADSTTGTHSRDGIFIAWGKGINAGVPFSTQPNLRDVGPTALASLGCSLTTDLDGRALMEVFSDEPERPRLGSSYRDPDRAISAQPPVYSASEEAELRERMRALGYIE
ncbi:MAG TPA: alkaline phosphatase family protein, partial [Blastocatellia bacterium]|nr:alkaline phosphatase family protein [Blastocatellia bacterium]